MWFLFTVWLCAVMWLWWSMTWVCWTTCLTSSAACMENLEHMVWWPCPSLWERASISFWLVLFPLRIFGLEMNLWPLRYAVLLFI
jgi:hypothetical protein